MTVSDEEMLEGVDVLARREGVYGSPEAGAAVVATGKLREGGFLGRRDEVVVFATGAGMKHTELVTGGYAVVGKGATVEELASVVNAKGG